MSRMLVDACQACQDGGSTVAACRVYLVYSVYLVCLVERN